MFIDLLSESCEEGTAVSGNNLMNEINERLHSRGR